MIHRPSEFSAFEFVVLSGLRAAQLMRGCTPRIEGAYKTITTAQLEVASGKVVRAADLKVARRLKATCPIGTANSLELIFLPDTFPLAEC